MSMERTIWRTVPVAMFLLLVLPFGAVRPAAAQEPKEGPLTPPPKHEVTRIPVGATAEAPPIPVEEIIRRLAQKEDEFAGVRSAYTYRKTVRVQELGEDNKPSGEFELVSEPAVGSDGKRYERVVQQPPSTLRRLTLAPEDLEIIARMPLFPLTTEMLSKYELTYAGKQPLDELTTYIFRVQPKQRERTRAYFEGVVWVDDRDLLIVKTYGK
ncbi:MAG TPA: hypothetical protein VHM88_27120, partial [Candidatus Acidoferrales bacterium]|nr:hypothetical protein [Candidatus Acidoferrales bacterium]